MATRQERIADWLVENKSWVTEGILENTYEEILRESYGDVNVCGMVMDAVHVLRRLDEIAFREGFNNWLDSEDYKEIDGMYYTKEDYEEAEEAIDEEIEQEKDEIESEGLRACKEWRMKCPGDRSEEEAFFAGYEAGLEARKNK